MEKKCYIEDGYGEKFKTYAEVEKAVKAAEDATVWQAGVTTTGMTIVPIEGPLEVAQIVAETGLSEDAVFDTASHTGAQLMLVTGGKTSLLRGTALKSLFDTAKIQGSALGRLGPLRLAEVLNHCLKVASGSSLLLHRHEKCSAVLSDNGGGYRIMPMSDLLEVTAKALNKDFGVPVFRAGYMDHDILMVEWSMPDKEAQIMDAYRKLLKACNSNIYSCQFTPAVKFLTSDTGNCAATLIPYLASGSGAEFALCEPIKVHHQRLPVTDGVERFKEKAADLFPTFLSMGENLERLSNIPITYVENAFIAICRKIGLAKKYAAPALELLLQYTGGGTLPCTGYDLYICLSESVGFAKKAGYAPRVVANVFECISRVLRLDFTDFDVPGTVAWGNN